MSIGGGISESLTLDIGAALAQVRALEDAINRAASAQLTVDAGPVTRALDTAVEAADTQVTVTADAAEVTGSIDAAVDAADTTVTIAPEVDSSQIVAAERAAAGFTGGVTNATAATGGLAAATAKFGGIAKAAIAGIGVAAVADLAQQSVQAASDLVEAQNLVKVVFEDSAVVVEGFARTAATSVGLAADQALQASAAIGGLFLGFGETREEAARLSNEIVTLAADLTSAKNIAGGVPEGLNVLRAALVGEIEPIRRLGVSFNAAEVEAKALEQTNKATAASLTEGEKAAARYALILEDLGAQGVIGDFARTSDQLANSQRILTAQFREAQQEIGTALLPVVLQFVTEIRAALPQLVPPLTELAKALAELAVAGLPLVELFVTALVPALEGLTNILKVVAVPVGLLSDLFNNLPGPVVALVSSFGNLASFLDDVANAADRAGDKLGFVGDVALGISSPLLFVADKLGVFKDETEGAGEAVEFLINPLYAAGRGVEFLLNPLARASDGLSNIVDVLGLQLDTIPKAIKAQDDLAKSTRDLAVDEAEAAKKIADVRADLAETLAEIDAGLATSIRDLDLAIADAMQGVVDSFTEKIPQAADAVGSSLDEVRRVIEEQIQAQSKLAQNFRTLGADAADAINLDKTIAELKVQAADIASFFANIQTLASKGLDATVGVLLAQGPEAGAALAAALLAGTDEQQSGFDAAVSAFDDTREKVIGIAEDAAKELPSVLEAGGKAAADAFEDEFDLAAPAEASIDDLRAAVASGLQQAATDSRVEAQKVANEIVGGIVAGLEEKREERETKLRESARLDAIAYGDEFAQTIVDTLTALDNALPFDLGFSTPQVTAPPPVAATGGGGARLGLAGDTIIINNPVGEPSEESLERVLRRRSLIRTI